MRFRILSSLLFLAVCLWPQQSQAQFWKDWFHKEQKRKPRPRNVRPGEKSKKPLTTPVKKKHVTVEYPASQIKMRYRIDILAPVYLDELVKDEKAVYKDRLPDKVLPGISFYEGAKLAADTLTRLGYNMSVYFHDITQKGLSPEEMVRGDMLDESDLIIGMLQSQQIPVVADFAKKKKINFISVVSPADAGVKDNLYFTMLQPTLEAHCDAILKLGESLGVKKKPVLIYRTGSAVDSAAYTLIEGGMKEPFQKIAWSFTLQKLQLERFFDSTQTNLVYIPILDNNYADSLLTALSAYFPDYRFEILGMPSWKFLSGLRKTGYYPNLGINFTSPFHYDMTTGAAAALMSAHRRQFGSRMAEMVFRGYEVLYWYAYLLKNYGTIYNPRQADNNATAFTKFVVKLRFDKDQEILYNENTHLYLYRYEDGSFSVNDL